MTLSKLNYVNVGPNSTFEASGDFTSTPEDVDNLLTYLTSSGKHHIVIHLHGGLISEKKGMAIAEKIIAPYEAAGAHPVSIVYETGFLETLSDNLTSIRNTKLFTKLLKYVRKYVAKKLGVGITSLELPIIDETIFNRPADELESDDYFTIIEDAAGQYVPDEADDGLEGVKTKVDDADLKEIEEWLDADEGMQAVLSKDASNPLVVDEKLDRPGDGAEEGVLTWGKTAWTILKIGKRVLSRLLRKRDHGAYCTIVEEVLREVYLADFGEWTWTKMKNKAHDMFQSNENRSGLEQHPGRYLMDGLAKLQADNADAVIDVVGHSLGTVAACELLDAMEDILKIRNIAFLAPAVQTEKVNSSLITKQERFDQFRMFTMSEHYERHDKLVGIIYPRSLLYFISGVLEETEVDETLLGMARHLTGTSPYNEQHLLNIVQYLDNDPLRAVWSVTEMTAPEGQRPCSETHGGFDDDDATLGSLTYYLKTPVS